MTEEEWKWALEPMRRQMMREATQEEREGVEQYIDSIAVPCDDAISRQAAINVAIDAVDDWDGGCNLSREEYIRKALETIPPVTPAEKVGYWIIVDKGLITTSYKCSECGRIVRDDTGYDVSKDYPYCHCGAKMQEVE